jgi:hypothetical protein
VGKSEGKKLPEPVDVQRVILKRIIKTYDSMVWTGLTKFEMETGSGFL